MELFDEYISFEKMIFSDHPDIQYVNNLDEEFIICTLCRIPKFRPFLLSEVVHLAAEYCQSQKFKDQFISDCSLISPVILHRLFKIGVYSFDEILNEMKKPGRYRLAAYFLRQPLDYEDYISNENNPYKDLPCSFDEISGYVEFGFAPFSIEYALKYDEIEVLQSILSDPSYYNIENQSWNLFEWTKKPNNLDALSFSGYFGSIKCFKRLLFNNCQINEGVIQCVISGGSNDLFHIVRSSISNPSQCLYYACQHCRYSFIDYFLDQSINLDCADQNNNWTSLMVASKNGHISIAQVLFGNGANRDIQDCFVKC